MKVPPFQFFWLLLIPATMAAFGEAARPLDQAWKKAASGFTRDAADEFALTTTGQPSNREAQYGMAVTLLDLQPKTRSNVEDAARHLKMVVSGGGDDDLGISARYLEGRLEQVHRFEPDLSKAEIIYDTLFREHPEHSLAQLGFAKSTMLKLFRLEPGNDRVAVLQEAEKAEAALSDPNALRAFHEVMAKGYEKFTNDSEARLRHLCAIERIGPVRRENLADLLVTIAEASRKAGQMDLAAEYYRKFLATFDRDSRRYLAEQRLAALEGKPSLLVRP